MVSSPHRRAFSLTELMIVIGIIVLLMAISFAVFGGTIIQSKAGITRSVLDAISTNLPKTQISVQFDATGAMVTSGGTDRPMPFGDIDGDQVLDALPRAEGAPASLANAPASYLGFVRGTGFSGPGWAVDPRSLQVRDPWGHPVRIRFPGGKPVLWSVGPDGIDGTSDDLKSWE